MIHPGASVHRDAQLDSTVEVGPWSNIGAGVEIDAGTRIGSHVVIKGPSRIGRDNRIFHFCSIGEDPQDKKYAADRHSRLEIGSGNTIREYCSINRGTDGGGGVTRIGDRNWLMAYVHIAHDCQLGGDTVFANNATLAGHVVVEDFATLGGFTGVHQFCRMGAYSFSGIGAVIVKDVPPFTMVSGNTARAFGLNREGLRRNSFDPETVERLRQAYRILYRQALSLSEAIEQLQVLADECRFVKHLVDFVRESKRGIVR